MLRLWRRPGGLGRGRGAKRRVAVPRHELRLPHRAGDCLGPARGRPTGDRCGAVQPGVVRRRVVLLRADRWRDGLQLGDLQGVH